MATFFLVLFVVIMTVVIAWDAVTLEIPDTASIILVAGFMGGALIHDAGWVMIIQHAAAGVLLFALGAGLFALGIWGGGDVKFMAAAGLWFGWDGLAAWLIMVTLAGGVLALAILLLRCTVPTSPWWPNWLRRLHRRDEGIPYGVALGAGGLLALDRATAFLPSTGAA